MNKGIMCGSWKEREGKGVIVVFHLLTLQHVLYMSVIRLTSQ